MKSFQLLAIIAVIFSVTSYIDNNEEIAVAASTAPSFFFVFDFNCSCFDLSGAMRMDYWYFAFNFYQTNGYAMEIAD